MPQARSRPRIAQPTHRSSPQTSLSLQRGLPPYPSASAGSQERPTDTMRGFKDPTLQDRAAAGQKAREKALQRLADKAPVDEAVLAERKAAREAKEAAAAEKSAARKAALAQEKADKKARAAEAEAAAAVPQPTEADRKAARDAKYAARKNRK